MSISKKILLTFLVLFAVTVMAFPAAADASASRTLPSGTVAPGEEFTVAITASDYGTVGQVVETLPAGFSYVSASGLSLPADVSGNTVTFYLFGSQTSFSYNVEASNTADTYNFAGDLNRKNEAPVTIGGDTQVTVAAGNGGESDECSATRTLPAGTVAPGEDFTVTITADHGDDLAQVVETLPAGFSYVSASGLSLPVDVSGNTVTFYLTAETSFSYSVTASDTAGTYNFAGAINCKDEAPVTVGGDTQVTVAAENGGGSECSATRTLPAGTVAPGEEFTVTVTADHGDDLAQVLETLPAGFSYVSASGLSLPVDDSGNPVIFYLSGETSFSYNVTASDTAGTYNFAGAINCQGEAPVTVGGDTQVTVAAENGGESECSATRTLPAGAVAPGEEFTVTITAEHGESLAQVLETLPAEFSYVSASGLSLPVDDSGNPVIFYLSGETSFSYNVTASSTADTYYFAGAINCRGETPVTIGGDTEVVVAEPVVIPDEGICLTEGWNFVSVPYTLADPCLQNILLDLPVNCVMFYDPCGSGCDTDCGKWYSTMSKWYPLKGYWIHATEDCCIPAERLTPKAPSNPPALCLYEGWNGIGHCDSTDMLYAETVLKSIDSSYQYIMGPWDPAAKTYTQCGYNGETGVISGKHMGTDVFEMNPYEGYWVYVTENCTYSPIGC